MSVKTRPILGLLQNQWFRDPDKVRRILSREDEAFRIAFIRRTLFMSCLTGRRLQEAFGEWIERFVFEETSRAIGGVSSSAFPADHHHIRAVITRHDPAAIVAFGERAAVALRAIGNIRPTIYLPHPAARGADTMPRLRAGQALLAEMFLTPNPG